MIVFKAPLLIITFKVFILESKYNYFGKFTLVAGHCFLGCTDLVVGIDTLEVESLKVKGLND